MKAKIKVMVKGCGVRKAPGNFFDPDVSKATMMPQFKYPGHKTELVTSQLRARSQWLPGGLLLEQIC